MNAPRANALVWLTRHRASAGAGIVLGLFLLLILLVAPLREFPIEDDWDYAKTVWNLLQTGAFHRLEVTQATVFFPAVWGALFARLFGYSFATLRVSTLALAAGTLMFFYALLGELGFDAPRRVLATLALMVTPVFVYLAFSFMTDIPFLFGYSGALYGYTRAVRRGDARWALVGSALAACAFLARQVGLLIPAAFGLFVLIRHVRRGPAPDPSPIQSGTGPARWREDWGASLRWILAGCAIPLAAAGAYGLWTEFLGGANWADRTRTFSGTLGFWLQPDFLGVLRRRLAIAVSTTGLYLLPLWLAGLASLGERLRLARARLIGLGLSALVLAVTLAQLALTDQWFPYLTDILTRRGLRPYLSYFAYNMDAHRPLVFSLEASAALTILAGLCGLGFCALIIGRIRTPMPPELALVYGATLLLALASLTFFTYFERYLLPLLPGLIILLLDATRQVRFSARVGVVGFVIVAACSTALMRDYFAWNEVKWDAGRALLAAGVPVEQIDGGYEWDGWYLYDASAAYIRAHDQPMTIDPWQYLLDPRYIFAFQPPPGYHVTRELPFATPLRPGGVDRVLLLERGP
ncbi:MAG: glycosyltransferase family 39 protein [Chloroflexi bacterium]|nr:glycosyltransferase family 39 protein [Chloroflexota bacterium]